MVTLHHTAKAGTAGLTPSAKAKKLGQLLFFLLLLIPDIILANYQVCCVVSYVYLKNMGYKYGYLIDCIENDSIWRGCHNLVSTTIELSTTACW